MRWESPPESVPPLRGEAHLWRLAVSAAEDERFASVLSREEAERAAKFRVVEAARRFVTGRGGLRLLLAWYLGGHARDVKLKVGDQGKPRLTDPRAAVRFNLSHSGQICVIAIAPFEVGIDIERKRADVPMLELSKRFFSQAEHDGLMNLPEHARRDGFYSCWVRKEAYLKLLGAGVTGGLDTFSVSVDPSVKRSRIVSRGRDCAVISFVPAPGYSGALVSDHEDPTVRCFDFELWRPG